MIGRTLSHYKTPTEVQPMQQGCRSFLRTYRVTRASSFERHPKVSVFPQCPSRRS